MMLAQFHFKPAGSPWEPPGFVCLGGLPSTIAQRAFDVVPPQNMQIGNHIFTQISFVTPVSVQESLSGRNGDGWLPTLLFRRPISTSRKKTL